MHLAGTRYITKPSSSSPWRQSPPWKSIEEKNTLVFIMNFKMSIWPRNRFRSTGCCKQVWPHLNLGWQDCERIHFLYTKQKRHFHFHRAKCMLSSRSGGGGKSHFENYQKQKPVGLNIRLRNLATPQLDNAGYWNYSSYNYFNVHPPTHVQYRHRHILTTRVIIDCSCQFIIENTVQPDPQMSCINFHILYS